MHPVAALLLSIAIEAATAAVTLRLVGGRGTPAAAGTSGGTAPGGIARSGTRRHGHTPPLASAVRRAALAAALATLATHTAAWYGVAALEGVLGYGAAVLAVEAQVVLVESLAYRWIVPLAWRRALPLSLIANLASTAFGLALYALGFA